jgi:hypothetical protein
VVIHEIVERRHFGRGCGSTSKARPLSMGRTPSPRSLPPHIDRPDTAADAERYQTIYAAHRGSIAARPPACISTPR